MDKKIIEAVERLNRAGAEHARVTASLFKAAKKVARMITEAVQAGTELTRGYYVKKIYVEKNDSTGYFLCKDVDTEYGDVITEYVDGIGNYLYGDIYHWIPPQDREIVMQFAKDVADGFLDEVSKLLEDRIAETNKAVETLERHSK